MPSSPTQFDYAAGLDLSALSTASLAQIIQAINQLAPLSNVGGVIVLDGGGASKTQWPGVVNNPRFKRYIWLDTNGGASPVAKVYDQSGVDTYDNWTTLATVADGSVTDSKIVAASININKLIPGTARYLVRTSLDGTVIEFVAPASAFNTNEITLDKLSMVGAPSGDLFLRRIAGVNQWATYNPTIDISNVDLSKIKPGPNGRLLWTDKNGIVNWLDPNDSSSGFLPNGTSTVGIPITKIATTGGTNGNVVGIQNGVVSWTNQLFTQEVDVTSAAVRSVNVLYSIDTSALTVSLIKYYRLTLICTSADNGYSVGDEIDSFLIYDNVSNFKKPIAHYFNPADKKVYFVIVSAISTIAVKALGKGGTTLGAMDLTTPKWSFRARVYA